MAAQAGTPGTTPAPASASPKSVNTSAASGLQAMQMVDAGQVVAGEVEETPKGPAKGRAPKGPEVSVGTESVEARTGPDWADLEGIFDIQEDAPADVAPEAESEEEDFPQDASDEERQEFGNRAQKRIRSLVGKTKELSGQLSQASQRIQQYDQWAQQVQQYNARTQQQMQQQAIQLARLEALIQSRQQPAVEDQDPTARFKNQFAQEVLEKARGELSPEVKAVNERLERFERQQQEQRTAMVQAQRKAVYNAETDKAVKTHIVPLLHSDDANELGGQLGDLVLLMAMLGDGQAPISFEDSAKRMRDTILKTAKSIVKARTQKVSPKVQSSQQAPTTAPRGRSGTKAESTEPDWATKSVSDFKKFVQRDMAGRR